MLATLICNHEGKVAGVPLCVKHEEQEGMAIQRWSTREGDEMHHLLRLKQGLINIDAIQSLVVEGVLQGHRSVQYSNGNQIHLQEAHPQTL